MTLTVVRNEPEAEVVCGLLRSNGIACSHRRTDISAAAWDATGSAGPTEILVSDTNLDAARALIGAPEA